MGIIIAGIVLGVISLGFGVWYDVRSEGYSSRGLKLYLLCFLFVLAGFFVGTFVPVSGIEETVSTTKLVSLRDETISEGSKRHFYISISGNNSYTYYVEVDSPHASGSQKAYKSDTISSDNVTIIEDDSYTDAKLVTYERHGKETFWTFGAFFEDPEYVFYVPTGTIVRDVSLG